MADEVFDHSHDADGRVIVSAPSESNAEVEQVAEVAKSEVEIARIEAERDVTIAKVEAKVEEASFDSEVEALRAELSGVKEALRLLQGPPVEEQPVPDPAPSAPVVVQADVDQSVPEPPPHEEEHHEERRSKPRGLGAW